MNYAAISPNLHFREGKGTPAENSASVRDRTYEFHTYENAGHAFFAVDRPQYRQAAAVDGWEKVCAFFGKHLR
jgi:carboxymethylenebutenolidase